MNVDGARLSGSCSTRVTIQTTFSVSISDGLTVNDNATIIPPLHIGDSVIVSDRPGGYTALRINDSALISDNPFLTGPWSFGESANVTDKATVSLGGTMAPITLVVLTVVFVSIIGVAIAVWRVLLMKIPG